MGLTTQNDACLINWTIILLLTMTKLKVDLCFVDIIFCRMTLLNMFFWSDDLSSPADRASVAASKCRRKMLMHLSVALYDFNSRLHLLKDISKLRNAAFMRVIRVDLKQHCWVICQVSKCQTNNIQYHILNEMLLKYSRQTCFKMHMKHCAYVVFTTEKLSCQNVFETHCLKLLIYFFFS